MPRPAAWRTTTSHARFLSAFVALTLALSGGLLSAGVIVDPHGLFGTGRYPVLVATSRSEKVASLATASPPQALIFGSSIMMRVDPAVVERLTTLTTFNLSVDSGKSEDFVALLDYGVRDLRLRPRLAIVGLSPRTFTSTENEGFDHRLLANDRLLRYVPMNPAVRAWRRAAVYLGTLDWTYMSDVNRSHCWYSRSCASTPRRSSSSTISSDPIGKAQRGMRTAHPDDFVSEPKGAAIAPYG